MANPNWNLPAKRTRWRSSKLAEQFDKVFAKAAEETLQELGNSVQTAVMFHLEKIQGVSINEILKDPKVFSIALGKIFGTGSKIIEDKIVRIMCKNLGIEYEKSQGTLEQKLSMVQNAASNRRSTVILN